MQSTPSGWRVLLDSGWTNRSLKALTGGEELAPDLARRLLQATREVWNLYGPTETTIWSTLVQLKPADPVTIGRPIANTSAYVLDAHRQPVPRGVAGELYIGGTGLALGYLDDPDETAERFVSNPFGPGRLYRTGDLARWRSNGNLDFLGRNDRQVKLRGFRVELGEVESTLTLHPDIRQAAAVIWSHPDTGERQLLAHVVGDPGGLPDWQELARFAQQRLPDYMVPQRWNRLEALPLTPNGKVDRKRLPAPEVWSAGPPRATDASDTERRVLEVWRRVLGHEDIGLLDSFFEAGGTSMLALRLISEIDKEFGQRLPVSMVFTAGTVSGFAAALEGGPPPQAAALVAARTTGTRPPLFVAPGHDGDQFALSVMLRYLSTDQPVYGLEPQGLEIDSARTVQAIASQYVGAMKTVRPSGPYLIAGYCSGGLIGWEVATQLREAGEDVPLLVLLDASPDPPPSRRSSMVRLMRSGHTLRAEWDAIRRTRQGRRVEHLQNRFHRVRRRLRITLIEYLGLGIDNVPRAWRTTHEEAQAMQDVMRLHQAACQHYRPKPYPGRVALLLPTRIPPFSTKDVPDRWRRLVAAGITVRSVPCTRFRLLSEPFVQDTGRELDDLILQSIGEKTHV